jgi:tetrahydromethanopterin S-methyltransferase subunit A
MQAAPEQRILTRAVVTEADGLPFARKSLVAIIHNLKDMLRKRVLGRRRKETWPFASGPYYVVDETAPIVIVMPDNDALAEDLAALSIRGLCMICPVCRSVSDIEKLTRNVEANLAIQFLVLVGGNGNSRVSMEALSAIFGDSDEISDKAAALAHAVRGRLKSFDFDDLEKRVRVVDMLDCVEPDRIIAGVSKLGSEAIRPNTGFVVQGDDSEPGVERVLAPTNISSEYQEDKAGTYAISTDRKYIVVEHFDAKGKLLRRIEGTTARDLCITLIRNGWVSKLDHAAYLGRELTLAEIAIRDGTDYRQEPTTGEDERRTNTGTK